MDNFRQGQMPLQYTPDQPMSADNIDGKWLTEMSERVPGLFQAIAMLVRSGQLAIPSAAVAGLGGMAVGGPPGGVIGMLAGGAGGALTGGAAGYHEASRKLREANTAAQMPPMPNYPAQPGLEYQMPPMPEYMPAPPSGISRVAAALRGR